MNEAGKSCGNVLDKEVDRNVNNHDQSQYFGNPFAATGAFNNAAPAALSKDNFVGMWHVKLSGGNFLQTLIRTLSGEMVIDYRFRYYNDDKIGSDSSDERRFYRAIKPGATQEELLQICRQLAAMIAEDAETAVCEIVMDETGFDGVFAKMKSLPAFHFEPVEDPASD
jgi:hypothetical protein